MVHVRGLEAEQVTARTADVPLSRLVAVPVDVGKHTALAMACDFTGRRLVAPFEFPLDRAGLSAFVGRVGDHLPADAELVRVGVEACGHYHRPVVAAEALPDAWQLVELNPAWVTAQRRINGSARRKTDPIDLVAITDLLLAGRGYETPGDDAALVELTAWAAHRRRRVAVRTALKNQLTGQLDRCFPGLGGCLSSVLDTKVGRLVATDFADPARLARLGAGRFRAYAARRDVRVSQTLAERLVAAARQAPVLPEAGVAREVAACDLELLADLDRQIGAAETRLGALLPATDYHVLVTGPGWGAVRCGAYAAAVGTPARWGSHAKIYRAAGLDPAQYESAGRRRDGSISREGSVELRRALLGLGTGLWHQDPPSRAFAAGMRERGKPGGIIATALARRANKIAFSMVRHQTAYDPALWTDDQEG